jgi:hypothetical protein
MVHKDEIDDAAFAAEVMGQVATTAVPLALEARILADFERVAAVRRHSPVWRLAARWRDRLWPGAPVWQPATLLAASLAVGLIAGAMLPASGFSGMTASSTDQTLSAMDTTTSPLDAYKDL